MGRPRVHDEGTRQRLLSAAEAMVAEGGVEALSVRRVAQAANTTTRAVYSVFGGKEGIIRELRRESWLIQIRRLKELPMTNDPADDMVRVGIDGYRWYVLNHPNLFHLAFGGRSPAVAPMREDLEVGIAARAALLRFVQRCADAGLLGGRPADLVAYQFHALEHGLAMQEVNGWFARYGDPLEIWEGALRAFMRGMAEPPPKRKGGASRAPRVATARLARKRGR